MLRSIPIKSVTLHVLRWSVGFITLSKTSFNNAIGFCMISQLFHLKKRPRYMPNPAKNSNVTIIILVK